MTRTPAKRLSEVATKVGVSEATVSRVLNGKAGVSDSTREAVLTALDVLGYERPTRLRGQRARLIGLVVPELQNPIFPALAEVIGGALAQRGFTPVLCTRTAGGLSEADYVDMLLEQHASGLVFISGHFAELAAPHEHYELLREKGIPVVLINAAIDGLDFPCVSTDDHSAASQAFAHLLALGHDRIGMVLALAAQARGVHRPRRSGRAVGRAGGARAVLPGGRAGRHHPDPAAGGDRPYLRERRPRARCDPGRPAVRPVGARRRIGGRLR
jgi:DNA-binding LacI/PurR family transcriptional regulator